MISLRHCALLLALTLGTPLVARADDAPTGATPEQTNEQGKARAKANIAKFSEKLRGYNEGAAKLTKNSPNIEAVLVAQITLLAGIAGSYEVLEDDRRADENYRLAADKQRALVRNTEQIYSGSFLAVKRAWCQYQMGNYTGSPDSADALMAAARAFPVWQAETVGARNSNPAKPIGLQWGDFFKAAQIDMASMRWDDALADCQIARNLLDKTPDSTSKAQYTASTYRMEAGIAFMRGDKPMTVAKWATAAAKDGRYADADIFGELQTPFNLAVAEAPGDVRARIERARYFQRVAARKRETKKNYIGGLINIFAGASTQEWSFDEAALYDLNAAWNLAGEDGETRAVIAAMRANSLYFFRQTAPARLKANLGTVLGNSDYAEKFGRTSAESARELARYYELSSMAEPDKERSEKRQMYGLKSYSRALYYEPKFEGNAKIEEYIQQVLNSRLNSDDVAAPDPAPVSALDWKNAGNAILADNPRAALKFYQKALEVDPNFADAMNNIGTIYKDIGALNLSRQWLDKAIAADPKNRVAYLNRGSIYENLRDEERAMSDYQSAVNYCVTPAKQAEAHIHVALILRNRQQWPQALEAAHRALELAPDAPSINWFAGQIELEVGHLNAALPLLQKAEDLGKKRDDAVPLLRLARDLKSGVASPVSAKDKDFLQNFIFGSSSTLRQTYNSPVQRAVFSKWLD